jgi:hypothetical protein
VSNPTLAKQRGVRGKLWSTFPRPQCLVMNEVMAVEFDKEEIVAVVCSRDVVVVNNCGASHHLGPF